MTDPPRAHTYATPWGDAWIAHVDDEIVALGLPGSAVHFPETADPPASVEALAAELGDYWNGGLLPAPSAAMMRAAGRTELTAAIYRTVVGIPTGSTMTYSQVAEAVGRPRAARAVGAAMATNRFAPMIPCHRVVGRNGTLRGYAGGLAMKRALLAAEGAGVDG